MRGKFVHNKVILATVVVALGALGYEVLVEHPICSGQRPPCVDAFVVVRGRRIAIEAECSTARIGNDVVKARKLAADLLIIIVPHVRLQALVGQVLKRHLSCPSQTGPEIQVFTLGAALHWISSNCPRVATRLAQQNQNVSSGNNSQLYI
jgi:hypothetical protein